MRRQAPEQHPHPQDVPVALVRRARDAAAIRGRLAADGLTVRVAGVDLTLSGSPRRAGRLTGYVLTGAGWLGLLLGAFAWLSGGPVAGSAGLGALFGAAGGLGLGLVTAGRIRPGRYELRVPAERADRARTVLMALDAADLSVVPARAPHRRSGAPAASDPRASADDLLGLRG
jgi:hypothetical protein